MNFKTFLLLIAHHFKKLIIDLTGY